MGFLDNKSPQQPLILPLYEDTIEPIRYNNEELLAESFLENERNRMKFLVQDVDDGIMILAMALDNLRNITEQNADPITAPPQFSADSDSNLKEDFDRPGDPSDSTTDTSATPSPKAHSKPSTNTPTKTDTTSPAIDPVPRAPPALRSCLKLRARAPRKPLPLSVDARPRQHSRKTALGAALAPILEVLFPGFQSGYAPAVVMTGQGEVALPEGGGPPVPRWQHPYFVEQLAAWRIVSSAPHFARLPAEVIHAVLLDADVGGAAAAAAALAAIADEVSTSASATAPGAVDAAAAGRARTLRWHPSVRDSQPAGPLWPTALRGPGQSAGHPLQSQAGYAEALRWHASAMYAADAMAARLAAAGQRGGGPGDWGWGGQLMQPEAALSAGGGTGHPGY